MQAIVLMIGAAFLWSLYPALIALSGERIGAPVFIMIIHISCGVSAAFFAWLAIKQKRVVWTNLKILTKSLEIEQWMYLMLIGLVSTLYNYCFIVAMGLGSKVGAAIIIEGWPIMAIFLAPLLVTKNWKKVRFVDYIAALTALFGVGLIIIGDQHNLSQVLVDFDSYTSSNDFYSFVGILVALVGSFCLALSIVLSTEVSNKISKIVLQEKDYSMTCAFIGEAVRRIVALIPSLFLLLAFPEDLGVSAEGVALSIFAGILIFNIGSMAVTLALLKSPSSTINMLYYLSPVLAVLWLYLIGMGDMTFTIMLGGILVIQANLLVVGKNKRDKKKQLAEASLNE